MAGRKRAEPDLLAYSNFRKYLRDTYAFRKSHDRKFSYGVFAKRAGIPARGHLKAVLDYGLKLTPETLSRYRKALGLTGPKGEYFSLLVALDQAVDGKEREVVQADLRRWKVEHAVRRVPVQEAEELFTHCARFLVRCFRSSPGFLSDPAWISRRLLGLITPAEAAEALAHLKRHGPPEAGLFENLTETDFLERLRRRIYKAAVHRRRRKLGYGGHSNMFFMHLTQAQALELDRKLDEWLKANICEPTGAPGTELCVVVGDVFALSGPEGTIAPHARKTPRGA